MKLVILVMSFVLVPSLIAVPPQIGLPYPLPDNRCSPFCQMRFPGQRPFTLAHERKMVGKNETFQLRLNDNLFDLNNVNHFDNSQVDLPFYQHRFYDDHRYQMYGLLASEGFVNDYYHYFIRDDDDFHHLGYYPSLTYDEEFDYFISLEKDGPKNQTSTYKLKGHKLVPRKESSPISRKTRKATLPPSPPFPAPTTANLAPQKANSSPPTIGVFSREEGKKKEGDQPLLPSVSKPESVKIAVPSPPKRKVFSLKLEREAPPAPTRLGPIPSPPPLESVPSPPPLESVPSPPPLESIPSPPPLESIPSPTPLGPIPSPTPLEFDPPKGGNDDLSERLSELVQDVTPILKEDLGHRIERKIRPLCPEKEVDQDPQEQRIMEVIRCALNEIYPLPPPAAKRIRTLNFISKRLSHNFSVHKMDSDVEKSHFLAQLSYESDGFSSTVERSSSAGWKNVLKNESKPLQWNCQQYKDQVQSDKNFFDHNYSHSKNSYQATFRGRGLIQLTGCSNYLGFFYYDAAQRAGKVKLSEQMKTDFYYTKNGKRTKIGQFCNKDILTQIANQFQKEGLILRPEELINDFQKTVDLLATPCEGKKGPTMTSEEFIVNSSFWYWKRCRQKKYASSLKSDSDKAVAAVSACVNGAPEKYKTYNASLCQGPNNKKDSHWTLKSFCSRLKAFNAFSSCFDKNN